MGDTRPDMPWRPAYEAYSITAWFAAAVCTTIGLARHAVPAVALWSVAAVAAGAISIRVLQVSRVLSARFSLEGRGPEWISSDEVIQKVSARPGHVWLGWGFEWRRAHAQRLFDLQKIDVEKLRVPLAGLWRRLLGRGVPSRGNPVLHGVAPAEMDLYVPLSDLYGHVFVAAITGAIKTRLLALLAVQAIRRTPREAVIVIDPKGDAALRDLLRAECKAAGRE